MRLGSLYLRAASATVSCNEGLIAMWNAVVEVANVRKGHGTVRLVPFRRACEAEK